MRPNINRVNTISFSPQLEDQSWSLIQKRPFLLKIIKIPYFFIAVSNSNKICWWKIYFFFIHYWSYPSYLCRTAKSGISDWIIVCYVLQVIKIMFSCRATPDSFFCVWTCVFDISQFVCPPIRHLAPKLQINICAVFF